jgi:serine/threonine-protein kinase
MLTGQVPFKGERAREVMDRHLTDPLVPPRSLVPEITDGVNDLIIHMMQKQVEKRYSDCDELLIELRAWKAYHTLRAGEQSAPARKA